RHRIHEDEDAGGEQAGEGERQQDAAEDLQAARAHHGRAPLEVEADLLEERHQDEDRQRHHRNQHGEDDAGEGAADAEFEQRGRERNAVGHLRDEQRQEVEEEQQRFSAEVAARQDVRSRKPEEEREEHHDQRDQERYAEDVGEAELVPGV